MEIKLWGPALSWAGAGGGVWPPCRRIPGVGAALTGPAYNEKLLIYHSDKTSRSFVTTTCPRQGHGTRWELICRVVLQRWRPASQNFDFPDGMDKQGHWTVSTGHGQDNCPNILQQKKPCWPQEQETGHYLFLPSNTYQYIYNGPLSHSTSSTSEEETIRQKYSIREPVKKKKCGKFHIWGGGVRTRAFSTFQKKNGV